MIGLVHLTGEKSKELQHRSDYNRVQGTQPRSHAVSFRKVTYGGIDGAYYTATTTRRTGGDGVSSFLIVPWSWGKANP